MKKNRICYWTILPSLILLLGTTACVKDVDLDQIDQIHFRPTAVVGLVDYQIEGDLIHNADPGIPLTMEKEVPFEIVTEDLEKNLAKVNLNFDVLNSLPRAFVVRLHFLTERGGIQEEVEFEIPPGTKEDPEVFSYTQEFKGNELMALNQATKVRMQLELQPGPSAFEGQLHLESTAAYQFGF